jgi:superfamily II DNA/RNA helicase
MVVYDEADRIFELGFAEQMHAITERMPKSR